MAADERSTPKRPFRFEIDVCIVTDDPDQASRLWCSVNDLLEALPGVFPQGGYFGPMPAEEVVPDSPLAKALA